MGALEYGLLGVDKYVAERKGYPDALYHRARVRAFLRAYDAVWSNDADDYEVIGVEKILLGPIQNLTTQKDSGYLGGGMLDLRLQEKTGRKQRLIMDHKFLRFELDQEKIDHLLIDGQPNQYSYLEYCNGYKPDGAIWDVIAKTAHRPTKEKVKVIPAEPEKILKRLTNGLPKGTVIPAKPEQRIVTPAETPEEFEERLLAVYMESPQKYFARPRVPILKNNVVEHYQELYDWVKELDMCKKTGKHSRNTDFCFNYSRPCQYLGLCTGRSSVDDGTWTTKDVVHSELSLPKLIQINGQNVPVDPHLVITNSRLKVYRGCRLKHDRQYNQGLVKVGEKPEEFLFIGSAGHVGLEERWKAIARNQGHQL